MKVIYWTPEYSENFECGFTNLAQLLDYLKVNNVKLYKLVTDNSYTYTVYKEGAEQAFPIRPEMVRSSLEDYDLLVIAPKLEGGVSAIVAVLAAWGLSTIASYAIAIVIVVAIVVGLGYLMQALSPNKKLTTEQDPSESSRIFNGVPNITEQGGSVPVVIGNCLFGGVRIGLKFEVANKAYSDVTIVANFSTAMGYPGTWLKIA